MNCFDSSDPATRMNASVTFALTHLPHIRVRPAAVEPSGAAVEVEDGQLIRDERGVRLARETESTD